MFKVYCPITFNLGDFLNTFPVLSGIAKGAGDQLKLVVAPELRKFNGFREFMQFQPCIGELVYRDEILNMEAQNYLFVSYSEEEFKTLTERPNRPIETMRNEKFIRDNFPQLQLNWEVDDDFEIVVPDYDPVNDPEYIVGDRWSQVVDLRRDFNILEKSGLFTDPKYFFLDYTQPLLHNAFLLKNSKNTIISTFTGAGMLADLLKKENICVYDDSMLPTWNGMPIEYSYWKHFYKDRPNSLFYLNDLNLDNNW